MNDRKWKGYWVDKGLKDAWLERLNSIKQISIEATCSGHRDRPAYVMYVGPKGDRDVVWALANLGRIAVIEPIGGGPRMSVRLIKPKAGGGFKSLSKSQWWSRVIRWLESWYPVKL